MPSRNIRRLVVLWLLVLLLGFTALFNLLGGAGTSCPALRPDSFGASMAKLEPYRWLYLSFAAAGILTGIYEFYATVILARGRVSAFGHVIVSLLAGGAVAGAQGTASLLIRGSGAPATWRFYVTAFALAVFLLSRIVARSLAVPVEDAEDPQAETGGGPVALEAAALLGAGALLLVVERLMSATHTFEGVDYARMWHAGITACALLCLFSAGFILVWHKLRLKESGPVGEVRA